MKAHLECISAPTADTKGASFLLLIDSKRYVFGNIHEGFQRAALEHGTKFSRVSDIFLTGKMEWRNTGGIIGMILTVADTVQTAHLAVKEALEKAREKKARTVAAASQEGKESPPKVKPTREDMKPPRLGLHGGPNISQTIATARRFIFRKGLPLDVHEQATPSNEGDFKPTWQDELLRVWAMPVTPRIDVSASASPSKRTFNDLLESDSQKSTFSRTSPTTQGEAESLEMTQKIVKDMFESDWRLDALFETNLRELELPATVFIRDPETKKTEKYQSPIAPNPADRPNIMVLARRPWPGALVSSLPKTRPSEISMCYICRTYVQRGKFRPEKAKELNIPKGDLYRRLAEGESVQLADGTTINPEQVLGPPRPSSGFMVSELPSPAYLDSFLSKPELRQETLMDGLKMMAWILGPGVAEDPRFQRFLQDRQNIKHVIASDEYSANHLVFKSAAAAAIRHADIDPQRYEYPSFSDVCEPLPNGLSQCLIAERGMAVHFEPAFKIDTNTITPPLNTATVWDNAPTVARDLGLQAQKEVRSDHFQRLIGEQKLPGENNEIITIGTGSALPSKYRNVSASILRVPGVGSYLFDCGENTLGQLARLYKPEQLDDLLRDLKMIWISHLHADHHLGTTAIIKAWRKAVRDNENEASPNKAAATLSERPASPRKPSRLVVASDAAMIQWLREYSEIEDFGIDRLDLAMVREVDGITSVQVNGREAGTTSHDSPAVKAFLSASGLAAFEACYVPHCRGAMGVALTFADGFKMTYSGDTRPASALVRIGRDSTVLLHEATFEDEKAGDAAAKNHSTTSEAITVGREMKAQRVILTHFSQRYTKIPVMTDLIPREVKLVGADEVDQDAPDVMPTTDPTADVAVEANQTERPLSPKGSPRPGGRPHSPNRNPIVAVAFDGMRVKVKDIMALKSFNPALMALYEGANDRIVLTEAEKEEKLEKARQEKIERKAEQRAKRERWQQGSRPGSARSHRSVEGSEAAPEIGARVG